MNELLIDKEKFAYAVIESAQIDITGLTDEDIAKRKLSLFLTTYYLIEKFNCLEKKDLRDSNVVTDMLSMIKFTE